jgi:putative transposase
MEVEVSARIGAERGQRTPERVTQRNGYRPRDWDTRVGTVELQVPKLRAGSYFPSLLEPRRRAERALAAVVMQCYVEGVSTRRVDDVARSMGLEGISKSQVSRICAELDELVAAWRSRPLDTGPYPFVWVDALAMKVREGGRICNTAVLVATACRATTPRSGSTVRSAGAPTWS